MEISKRVEDFLQVFQGKSKTESCDLIKSYKVDDELVQEIINIIECSHATQICDSICEVLFNLKSCGQEEGVNFCLQFIPALIWAYYSLISKNVKWSPSKVETLLLYIYNQIVQINTDAAFYNSFNIPTLAKPSIYHEPMLGVSSMLTEHTLSQHDKADRPILIKGPTKFLNKIPAGFRSSVIKSALQQYNDFLSFCLLPSLKSFSRMVIRLSSCGFPLGSEDNDILSVESLKGLQSYPKVSLNGDVMKEMVTSLHFIAFNGCADDAVTAMKCLHRRACYSICTAAVLATEALQDIINLSSDGCNFEYVSPVNPYNSKYRVVNLDSIQKRKTIRLTQSTPRGHRVQDALPGIRPAEASSPRSPEPFSAVACSSSLTSPDGKNSDGFPKLNGLCMTDGPEKGVSPVLAGLFKNVALIDNSLLNGATETDNNGHVNFKLGPLDFEDDEVVEEDPNESWTVEVAKSQKDTPKIVIDLSDISDDKNSDAIPLITCTPEKGGTEPSVSNSHAHREEMQANCETNGDPNEFQTKNQKTQGIREKVRMLPVLDHEGYQRL